MDRPLSEQLADLSKRAKKAEDDYAAAKQAGAEKIQAREDQISADAIARKAKFDQGVTTAESNVAAAWTDMTNKVQADYANLRADIDYKKFQHDRDKARRAADDAEESAELAINFAFDAIDNAEAAVLDATRARAVADSF
jgi:hypothetical protein